MYILIYKADRHSPWVAMKTLYKEKENAVVAAQVLAASFKGSKCQVRWIGDVD